MLLSALNAFAYSLLALSFRIVDVSAASVLYETWPVIFVALRQQLNRQPIHIHIHIHQLAAFTPAIAGTILVAASQHSDQQSFFHIDATTFLGTVIAITGGAAIASMAFTFSWAEQIHHDIFAYRDNTQSSQTKDDTRTALILIAFMATNAISLPINAIIATVAGETITSAQIALGLLTGIFIQGAGSILFRLANIFTLAVCPSTRQPLPRDQSS